MDNAGYAVKPKFISCCSAYDYQNARYLTFQCTMKDTDPKDKVLKSYQKKDR